MKCPDCGFVGDLKIARGEIEYDSLPGVTLRNVELRTCPACHETAVVIPAPTNLNQVLAGLLVSKPGPLTAAEFRFLRKTLGWSSQDTAKRLGVRPETVSRWENGVLTIGPQADRLLRLCVVTFEPIDDYRLELLEYAEATPPSPVATELEFRAKTWRAA